MPDRSSLRILIVTSELRGLLHAALEAGRRLREAGHEVLYCTGEGVRGLVESQGLGFHPFDFGEQTSRQEPVRESSWLRRFSGRAEARRARATALAAAFREVLVDELPEVVLLDVELHEQIVVALGWQANHPGALALLDPFVSIWRRPGLPPPHHLARPGVGWKGSRLGMWLLWELLRTRKRWRRVRLWIRDAGVDRISVLQELAAQSGFSLPGATTTRDWLMPFTYPGIPQLCLHALEFEFPHQPAQAVHYVGPQLLRQRTLDTSSHPAIVALQQANAERVIYATFGSFFTANASFVRELVHVFRERPTWHLVLSLGGRGVSEASRIDGLEEAPRNVVIAPWVPQPELLELADVAVVHGGTDTADECVLARVPMLVCCGFETDMAGTTSRVVHHGLGISLPRGAPAAQIAASLERLCSEAGFRRRLDQFAARYERYERDRVLQRTVEGLAAARGEATAGDAQ